MSNDNMNHDGYDAEGAMDRLEETRGVPSQGPEGETQNDLYKTAEGETGAVERGDNPAPPLDNTTKPADDAEAHGRGEGVGQAKETEGLSQNQIVMRRFFRHKGAMAGLTVLILIMLLSLSSMGIKIGPLWLKGWWANQDWLATHDIVSNGAPSGKFPFGQDTIGRDNFALVMKGVQTSIVVMVVMSAIAGLIGVTVGALAGYYRGWVDQVLMRFTDLVITLPTIVIGALLGSMISVMPDKMGMSAAAKGRIYDNMPLLLAVALGAILWTGLARLTRSEFMSLREREFVDSARVAGASDFRIITKHILTTFL